MIDVIKLVWDENKKALVKDHQGSNELKENKTMRFQAKIFYSGYVVLNVEADNEGQAIERARADTNKLIDDGVNLLTEDFQDFLLTLKPWEEADEIEAIVDGEPFMRGTMMSDGILL